jgi:23S rRNA (uracil1939-C5)-methyltransferase
VWKLKSKASSDLSQYKAGDRLEVAIERIVPNGFGIAFAEGLTIFAALAAAGDRAVVELTQIKKRTAFAEIVEIRAPSLDRIAPPCPYFGTCGGCDFQHLNYEAQLAAKVSIVKDCLTRIGKIELTQDIEIVGSPAEFAYRSRAQWHLDTQARHFGYFQRNSHSVVDVEHCPILAPELDAELRRQRANVQWETLWEPIADIEAASGENGEISIFSGNITDEPHEISYTAAGDTYLYSAKSFFQGNRFLVPKLLELAIGGAGGGRALDLYCGVGLFAIPLARKFKTVTGVEENPDAIDFAEKNADLAGLRNVEFYQLSVDKFLFRKDLENADLVVFDPPRSGADLRTVKRLAELRAKEISYVSCDPSILARDLRILLDSGYRIRSMTALDLFPQNHHVETVVRLSI